MPLIILAVGILFLFFLIVKVRLNSFLALLLVAGLVGYAEGLPEGQIIPVIEKGLGGTLGGLAIVVSFGAMLMESLLAVISLIAVASFAAGEAAAAGYSTPTQVFAGGVANFLEKLGMPHNIIFTLINLAVSAFALTSLDSVARIGRLSFQELFLDASIKDEGMKPWRKVVTNKYFATVITLVLAYILAKMGYKNIWPLFGSANQLLSALALIACAVYLKKTNRKGWMLWIPMVIMLCVTLTALVQKIIALIGDPTAGNILQLAFAVALFVLGVIVAVLGFRRLAEKTPQEAQNA